MSFDNVARAVARAAGRPGAFLAAITLVLGWAVTGPMFGWSERHSLFINTATTIITFLMVFLIQGAQNLIQAAQDRDTRAIQAKLDELIRAVPPADNRLRGIERQSGDTEQAAG